MHDLHVHHAGCRAAWLTAAVLLAPPAVQAQSAALVMGVAPGAQGRGYPLGAALVAGAVLAVAVAAWGIVKWRRARARR